MVGLGLLPLAALARFFGVSDEQTFLMPTPYALIVGFVIGAAVCGIIGRSMGLRGTQDISMYADRHRAEPGEAAAARRPQRPMRGRIRSTASAPFVRFS